MGENLIRIPDQVIEQLRCSQCEGYLSCGPVRLILDGTSICGQCSPPNSDVVYRNLILEETILKNVEFPCRFQTKGCRNTVAFGQAMEHESKCVYQSYNCPFSVPNDETCCWSGLQSKLLDHLTKNHSSRLLEAASFIVQIDQNCKGIFGVLQDDLVFLVTYLYLTSTHNLNYEVRYFSTDGAVSATYEINIENNDSPDCHFSLKENQCPIFDSSFDKLNNMLNLNKYMEALDNPNSIKINIILKDIFTRTLTVKQRLASLLCRNCEEYLVFPIFDVEQNKTVCCKCAYAYSNRKESTDMKLRQRIAETTFPCHWQDCNFTGTGDIIRTHEISCKFRDYSCPICSAFIKASFADEHLQYHRDTGVVHRNWSTLHKNWEFPDYVYVIENNKVIIVKNYMAGNTFMGELLLSTFLDEEITVMVYGSETAESYWVTSTLSKDCPTVDYKEIHRVSGNEMLYMHLES